MRFEQGKYYRHPNGYDAHILGWIDTTMWGRTMIAEVASKAGVQLLPFAVDESATVNWKEITTQDCDAQGLVFFDMETGKSLRPPFEIQGLRGHCFLRGLRV